MWTKLNRDVSIGQEHSIHSYISVISISADLIYIYIACTGPTPSTAVQYPNHQNASVPSSTPQWDLLSVSPSCRTFPAWNQYRLTAQASNHSSQLTSVVYPKYPTNAGTTTMYMSVIPAVRGVHRKYLCRFMNMSEVCKYSSVSAGEALVELTGIFDQRRVQRESCRVYVSVEAYLRISETSHTSFVTRHDESCGREPLLASCVVKRRPIWISLMSNCQDALSLNESHADSSAPPRHLSLHDFGRCKQGFIVTWDAEAFQAYLRVLHILAKF